MLNDAFVDTSSTKRHLLSTSDTTNTARTAGPFVNMNVIPLISSWHKPEAKKESILYDYPASKTLQYKLTISEAENDWN